MRSMLFRKITSVQLAAQHCIGDSENKVTEFLNRRNKIKTLPAAMPKHAYSTTAAPSEKTNGRIE